MSPLLIALAVALTLGIMLALSIAAIISDRRPIEGEQTMPAMPKHPTSPVLPLAGGGVGIAIREPVTARETQPIPVTEDQYATSRRQFFNRATYAVFGLVIAQFILASLAFFWPRLKGGFGATFNAGEVGALKADVLQGSTVVPRFLPPAQAWIVPIDLTVLPGSSYEDVPFVVTGEQGDGIGLMALWMRCPHLGCRVPECIPSQGFECPCHGSKFNIHGEYAAGPAPRNMDRFAVSTNDAGELIIDTGTIVQTSRSRTYSANYPQGPFCV